MSRPLSVSFLLGLALAASPAWSADFQLNLRRVVEAPPGTGKIRREYERAQWNPSETAVIICDTWDLHHCLNAVRREKEMAPRADEFLKAARGKGMLIIHAPSECMKPYEGTPARKRAQEAPKATNLPKDIGQWCSKIPEEEKGKYPIDQSDGVPWMPTSGAVVPIQRVPSGL